MTGSRAQTLRASEVSRAALQSRFASDLVGQKTLVAGHAHIFHAALNAGGQKFLAQTGQRWRPISAKQIWRDREIELIDQSSLEHRTEKSWPTFARHAANVVIALQNPKHLPEVDLSQIAEMQGDFFFAQSLPHFFRHALRRKNQDGRNLRLKNFQL